MTICSRLASNDVFRHTLKATTARRLNCIRFARSYSSVTLDPRLKNLGTVIEDDFASIRDDYSVPKHPIVLAHGLCGFDELHIAGPKLPGVHYWRGITEALRQRNVQVITADVPPTASIQDRAARLGQVIEHKAGWGQSVNIIAGLDARYLCSRLNLPSTKVLSLTTIATPHHGSAFADHLFHEIGPYQLPKVYKMLEYFGIQTGAFRQLTRKYMDETFNQQVPDNEKVRYFSYGAAFTPSFWSVFRQAHRVLDEFEGPNDGLVSVESSKWGTYKGTLSGVSHLDLINWTNRLRWFLWELAGNKRNFNAIAFYLDIADMLAKEGL